MIVALGIATAISAVFCILARNQGAKTQLYFFKPLTMAAIIAVVLIPAVDDITPYQAWVIAGLLVSLVGDIFLMFPEKKFVFGLAAFFLAHLCYIFAFSTDLQLNGITWWIVTPVALSGAGLAAALLPSVGRLKIPIVIYMLGIVVMVWLAWERWHFDPQIGSLTAAAGGLLFLISDSVLAINKFRAPFTSAQTIILSTYFVAQWLLAYSAI